MISGVKHAFALEGPLGPLTEDDRALLLRVAVTIDRRGMSAAAIFFLESLRPLNYIGSQAMVFLRPLLTMIFSLPEYEQLTAIMERREAIRALVDEIEAAMAARPHDDNPAPESKPDA